MYNQLNMFIEIYKNGKKTNTILITNQYDILIKLANIYQKKSNKKSNSKIKYSYKMGQNGQIDMLIITEDNKQYNMAINGISVESIDNWQYKYIISEQPGDNISILNGLHYNE